MKRFVLLVLLALAWGGLGTLALPPIVAAYDDYDDDYYDDDYDYDDNADIADPFYQDLTPYGRWFDHDRYGRVWQPRVAARDWRPYSDGHWIYTDYGWTWVPTEEWGWAPYHYGRWFHDPRLGWVWVPGREWAPAWVEWRRGDGWIGWAPLPPEARWYRGRLVRRYRVEPHDYCFVEERWLVAPSVRPHLVPAPRVGRIITVTRPVTRYVVLENRVANRSIDPEPIEKAAGKPVRRHKVEQVRHAVPPHAIPPPHPRAWQEKPDRHDAEASHPAKAKPHRAAPEREVAPPPVERHEAPAHVRQREKPHEETERPAAREDTVHREPKRARVEEPDRSRGHVERPPRVEAPPPAKKAEPAHAPAKEVERSHAPAAEKAAAKEQSQKQHEAKKDDAHKQPHGNVR